MHIMDVANILFAFKWTISSADGKTTASYRIEAGSLKPVRSKANSPNLVYGVVLLQAPQALPTPKVDLLLRLSKVWGHL